MDKVKVLKVVTLLGLLGWYADGSEMDENKIKVFAEASAPKNIKEGKIRLEYEFRTSCDEDEKASENKTVYKDCGEVPISGGSGVYLIHLDGRNVPVYCEVTPDGTKYLVFQRRIDGSQEFYRNWTQYENGFGNLSHEFWIGTKVLHSITSGKAYKLRIDLEAFNDTKVHAEYRSFRVGSPASFYTLTVNGYSGTADKQKSFLLNFKGDSLSYHDGQKFSTYDKDNDVYNSNCAVEFKGAWWYKSCHQSNLNGKYYQGRHTTYADGINWITFKGYYESMKTSTMKIY